MQDSDVCKETLSVLAYFDTNLIKKIPNHVLKKLGELSADSNTEFYINLKKNLNEQNISEKCKDLISLIYYNYIADKNEKDKLWNLWNENEKKYQDKLLEKYNPDKLFQKEIKKISTVQNTSSNNVSMIKYKKDSIFTIIINFIKNKFKKKH